jgi:hypothetical protein
LTDDDQANGTRRFFDPLISAEREGEKILLNFLVQLKEMIYHFKPIILTIFYLLKLRSFVSLHFFPNKPTLSERLVGFYNRKKLLETAMKDMRIKKSSQCSGSMTFW